MNFIADILVNIFRNMIVFLLISRAFIGKIVGYFYFLLEGMFVCDFGEFHYFVSEWFLTNNCPER